MFQPSVYYFSVSLDFPHGWLCNTNKAVFKKKSQLRLRGKRERARDGSNKWAKIKERKTERKREVGRISLIRGKGHSIAVIYIVKALRLSLRDSLLFMLCLTDSSDSFANTHWTPYKSDSSFRHLITFMPNYETFDKWGCLTKGISGLGGATSLSSKGSHMVWKIGTRSWRASVKELLGIETIGSSCFASNSIGLHYNSSDTVPNGAVALSCPLNTRL